MPLPCARNCEYALRAVIGCPESFRWIPSGAHHVAGEAALVITGVSLSHANRVEFPRKAFMDKAQVKELALGIVLYFGFPLGLVIFAVIFEAFTLSLAVIWLAAPLGTGLLNLRSVSACFTLTGIRRLRGIVMVAVVTTSALMCLAIVYRPDLIRNPIGRRFVQGYRTWQAEPEVGDDPVDRWTATNRSGRWGLQFFELTIFAAGFILPALTWKASSSAIIKKKSEYEALQSNANAYPEMWSRDLQEEKRIQSNAFHDS